MMRSLKILLLVAGLLATLGCTNVSSKTSSNSDDRRSAGTQLEDTAIETTAMARINEKYKNTVQITVTSYNRFVLLTGDATTSQAKADIEHIIRAVPNVKKIANEISVGGLTSSSIRRNDSSITSTIKSDLNMNQTIQAGTIKVTTEKGIVYLLGFVTHAEARVAAEIASTIIGVQKVMRVFEYIDQAE
jgi:osmotically-inducible protein OsmY